MRIPYISIQALSSLSVKTVRSLVKAQRDVKLEAAYCLMEKLSN